MKLYYRQPEIRLLYVTPEKVNTQICQIVTSNVEVTGIKLVTQHIAFCHINIDDLKFTVVILGIACKVGNLSCEEAQSVIELYETHLRAIGQC